MRRIYERNGRYYFRRSETEQPVPLALIIWTLEHLEEETGSRERARYETEVLFGITDEDLDTIIKFYEAHRDEIGRNVRLIREYSEKDRELDDKYGGSRGLLERIAEGDEEARRDYEELLEIAKKLGWY